MTEVHMRSHVPGMSMIKGSDYNRVTMIEHTNPSLTLGRFAYKWFFWVNVKHRLQSEIFLRDWTKALTKGVVHD